MTWYEDYYAGSSDYPLFHESTEYTVLTEEHEEPKESEHVPILREALAILTEKQRFVVELSWGLRGESCSFNETADLMGITPKAVHSLYSRAMGKMRGYMNYDPRV